MSDISHLREPKPLSDEAELKAKVADIIGDIVGGFNGGGNIPDIEKCCPKEMAAILQLIQSHNRQLEQRVLEARPQSRTQPQIHNYDAGFNAGLEAWSTKLKGVFNQTKGSDES